MKLYATSLFTALLLAVAFDATAGSCPSGEPYCDGKILQLYAADDSSTYNYVKLDTTSTPGCTLNGPYWQVKQVDTDVWKLLVAAYLADKTVRLRQITSVGYCTVSYVLVEP